MTYVMFTEYTKVKAMNGENVTFLAGEIYQKAGEVTINGENLIVIYDKGFAPIGIHESVLIDTKLKNFKNDQELVYEHNKEWK